MAEHTYVVVGATGQQGSAVVDALLDAGVSVVAVVRDPDSAASHDLAVRGVKIRVADQEDVDSLTAAARGATALYFMSTFADDTEGEVRRGRNVADAAVRAGIPTVVFSSVGGADRGSGVPHFESKRRIEQHLEGAVTGTLRIVRPVYFMENLNASIDDADPFVLRMPMPAQTPLQLVSVRDIGRVAASLMLAPGLISETTIEIGGDELTPDRIAVLIGERLARDASFEQVPLDSLPDEDLKAMFRWFVDTPAYDADFIGTRRLDPDVLDLTEWLARRPAS